MSLGAAHLGELEELARARLSEAAFAYFAGGSGDEVSLRENRAALDRVGLVPRVLRGTADHVARQRVLGRDLACPALVAPLAYQAMAHPDGDLATASAAAEHGWGMCVSSLSNHALEDVAAAGAGAHLFLQLYPYRDRGMTAEVVARAEASGYGALVVTVDVPVHGRREREARNAFALDPGLVLPNVPRPAAHAGPVTPRDVTGWMRADLGWDDVEQLMAATSLPLVLKGVLHPDDAATATGLGVAGLVLSNHGGRQLDGAIAGLDALAAVADRVGSGVELLVDGAVRRGVDVVKALARGAGAVLVGRPITWALAVGGRDGVSWALRHLQAEVVEALALCGCATPREAGPHLLHERTT